MSKTKELEEIMKLLKEKGINFDEYLQLKIAHLRRKQSLGNQLNTFFKEVKQQNKKGED
jgi:hypothetical protein